MAKMGLEARFETDARFSGSIAVLILSDFDQFRLPLGFAVKR